VRKYDDTCIAHYRPFWSRGVPVDVIDQTCEIAGYRLLIAPMLYMLRPGAAERIRAFVEGGGTLVMTYWSGIVDENDLCILGGWPGGGLREVLGVWDEEIDALYGDDRNRIVMADDNALGMSGQYETRELCGLIHPEGADVLATYGDDFYAGRAALTVNAFGQGRAYYVASRNSDAFLSDFYGRLIEQMQIRPILDAQPPAGVSVQVRSDGESDFVFLMNFAEEARAVDLGDEALTDVLTGESAAGTVTLERYGLRILQRPTRFT